MPSLPSSGLEQPMTTQPVLFCPALSPGGPRLLDPAIPADARARNAPARAFLGTRGRSDESGRHGGPLQLLRPGQAEKYSINPVPPEQAAAFLKEIEVDVSGGRKE